MLNMYRLQSDYGHSGCIIYGSTRKSYLQMLDPLHDQVLRLLWERLELLLFDVCMFKQMVSKTKVSITRNA